MCGIAGIVRHGGMAGDELARTVRRMADTLRHRGPDDGDVWTDAEAGIGLGHRRLSIIDLSPAGHQPMVSASGRFVLSYNGEIYNFADLRRSLESQGVRFRGASDSEVLLEACARWGVEDAVRRCIGMFAFALWDREARRLWLVRDRIGIKPLYWAQHGGLFLFGSELKALRAAPGWTPEVNRDAAAAFLRHYYVPAPHSIYRGVRKLEPGTLLRLDPGGRPEIERYWDLRAIARTGSRDRLRLSDGEAIEAVDELLRDAVRRRLVADVPLGAFLSGGINSSTVAALMQAESPRPVKTFTIGFHEEAYNEARHAKAIAAHLGTDHTELYVTPDDALDVIPSLPDLYDEPFADVSQLPTYLVSRLVRQHVTVALSGDGGDELFAGYNRYAWARRMHRGYRWTPRAARRAAVGAIRAVPPGTWDRLFGVVPAPWRIAQPGDKLYKLASVLAMKSPDAYYRRIVSCWPEPETLIRGAREPAGPLTDETLAGEVTDFLDRMRFLDMVTYLPGDILTKVDRASMAVSLEARVPLLDHRVFELVWRLPGDMLLRRGEAKWLLRRILERYVPAALFDRPKMGFGVPINSWLRGPLRDWAEDLLSVRRLGEVGLVEPQPVRTAWQEHLSGKRNWQYALWTILMLQAWHFRWQQQESPQLQAVSQP